jgi:hypothetical protein
MKRQFAVILVALILVLTSCDLFDVEKTVPEWYPSTLQYSDELNSEIGPFLNIFSNHNQRNDSRFQFDSTRNIYSDIDQVDIALCSAPVPFDDPEVLMDSVENALSDWARLISIEAFELDSCRIALDDNEEKLIRFYPKSTYLYPVYGLDYSIGRIQLKITNNGRIIDINSNLIPQYSVPATPNLNLSQAKRIISGYHYQTYGLYGEFNNVFSLNDIESYELEIFIDPYNDHSKITYHLAWRFTNHDGHFFVDAMTGDILYFYQQWRN